MTGILIEWVPTDEWGRTDGEWTVVRTVAEAAEALGPYRTEESPPAHHPGGTR